MPEYKIGRVVSVSGEHLIVSLFKHSEDGESFRGVPDSMEVEVFSPVEGGEPARVIIGQPGSFVMVYMQSGLLLCLVAWTSMRESNDRDIVCIPIGTIKEDGGFERGSGVLPALNSPAYAVHPHTISGIGSRG